MSELRVYLADLVAELRPDHPDKVEWPGPIQNTLMKYFDRIVQSQTTNSKFPFHAVKVEWWSLALRGGNRKHPGPAGKAPPVKDADFVIYFVRDPSDSIVTQMSGQVPQSDATGFTAREQKLGIKTGSEVYTSGNQDLPIGLANLAFHELMHNASHFDDAKLHGLTTHSGKKMSLSAATVYEETPLSEGDVLFMAKHLQSPPKREPWADGYMGYIDPQYGRS